MKRSFFSYILLLCVISLLSSCASWRKTSRFGDALPMARLIEKVEENAFQYEWFSAKLNIRGEVDNSAFPRLGGQLRLQKDKAIWISATAFLGIEALRLKITPDSVWMINKLENTYLAESFSDVMRKTGVNLSFSDIQNILVGNAAKLNVRNGRNLQSVDRRTYRIETQDDASSLDQYYILSDLFKISSMVRKDDHWKADLGYADFFTIGNQRVPSTINAKFVGKSHLSAVVTYSDMTLNEAKPLPLRIVENYERIYLR